MVMEYRRPNSEQVYQAILIVLARYDRPCAGTENQERVRDRLEAAAMAFELGLAIGLEQASTAELYYDAITDEQFKTALREGLDPPAREPRPIANAIMSLVDRALAELRTEA